MYSALVIASKFIDLGIQKGYPVNPMKLQKMVYFAHGLNLAKNNKPLINDEVQAWDYGPVIPNIYHTLKEFGNADILKNPIRVGINIGNTFKSQDVLDDESESIIQLAFEITKNMSAIQLSNWSHADGSAWQKTFDGSHNKTIKNDDIKDYFLQVMNNGN